MHVSGYKQKIYIMVNMFKVTRSELLTSWNRSVTFIKKI